MSKQLSNFRANQILESIRNLVKRFEPKHYTNFIRLVFNNINSEKGELTTRYPPHFLLHSLEANYSYYDSNLSPINIEANFDKLMNIYYSMLQPYHQYELNKNSAEGIINYLLSEAIIQFPIQQGFNWNIFSRSILLFEKSINLQEARNQFSNFYKISIHDWLILCFSIIAYFEDDHFSMVPENILNSEVSGLPLRHLDTFLKVGSIDIASIKRMFIKNNSEKSTFPPFLRIFNQSIFLEYPIIRFENEFHSPQPHLISHLAYGRVYDLFHNIPGGDFNNIFGSAFENYIKTIIEDIPNVEILRENEIRKRFSLSGTVCDFYLEFDNCILLLEAKGVKYTRRVLNLEYLKKSNSTMKVAKGYDQLISTSKLIKQKTSKPIYGMCVTFGDLYLINIKEFFDTVIKPRMTVTEFDITSTLSLRPITYSIGEFEKFVIILGSLQISPHNFFKEYFDNEYEVFNAYNRILSNEFKNVYLKFDGVQKRTFENFFNDIKKII